MVLSHTKSARKQAIRNQNHITAIATYLWDFRSEDETFRRLLIPTRHGRKRGYAIKRAVHLDRIEVLRVVAEKIGGFGAGRIEGALPPGGGESGSAYVERRHDSWILHLRGVIQHATKTNQQYFRTIA